MAEVLSAEQLSALREAYRARYDAAFEKVVEGYEKIALRSVHPEERALMSYAFGEGAHFIVFDTALGLRH